MSKQLIKELLSINKDQPTVPASILLAIRARMEHKAGVSNRIGSTFPNGNRGVLFVGKAGVGKTTAMLKMFEGLNLGAVNEGRTIGKWLPSTGGSTGVGIYEVLESYNDSIIFADELSLETEKHIHVMKQIANGELVRPRHGNIEAVPFSGLLIGATNAIKLPNNGRDLEHLLATLDRFMIVKTKATINSPKETMDIILDDNKLIETNWSLIAKALTRENTEDLTTKEKELVKKIWQEKSREILDPTRAQWRNSHAVLDIMLFCKRFFNCKDLTNSEEVISFAKDMIDDCVLFNPVGILWLSPLEQIIYDCIKERDVVATNDIINAVAHNGLSFTRMTIHRAINKMQESSLIVRYSHGKYSTKQPDVTYSSHESETSVSKEVLNLSQQL